MLELVLTTLLSTILGGVAGFLSSYFFWKRDRQKERPGLVVEGTTNEDGYVTFSIKNIGFTHAEDIVITFHTGSVKKFVEIQPGHLEWFTTLDEDNYLEVSVTYKDVWGKSYTSYWELEGMQRFEYLENLSNDAEHLEQLIIPYDVRRKDAGIKSRPTAKQVQDI